MGSLGTVAAIVVACGTVVVFAQAPVESARQRLTFDVASIKRSKSDMPGPLWGGSPGRWQMINGPVASLIWTAYDTPVSELPGAPAWVQTDRYDVLATHAADAGTAEPPARTLVRRRLVSRSRCAPGT